jgi:hypothetical protein
VHIDRTDETPEGLLDEPVLRPKYGADEKLTRAATSQAYPKRLPRSLDKSKDFNSNNVDLRSLDNEDLYSANVQLTTPTHEVNQRAIRDFETSGIPFAADPIPHVSTCIECRRRKQKVRVRGAFFCSQAKVLR